MNMKNYLKDKIINFLIKHQAPKRITYSSRKETRVFGFWIYLGNRSDAYVIQKRLGNLKYECIKVDAPQNEAGTKHVKHIDIENGYSFSNSVFVDLYYNGLQIENLAPVKAFFYGFTGFYKIVGWLENKKYRSSVKKNAEAYSLYCDRLRLLELIIDIRNKQHEQNIGFPERISQNTLKEAMARASVVTSQGYYVYTEPILNGLCEEGAISIDGNSEIEIKPKAWHLVSDYYVDERRHNDNQKSLKWQRYLTGLLAVGSIANIFREEIRAFFKL